MLRRRRQAEEAFAASRMACLKSFGLVLALQVAAAWATGATPAAGAAPAAPAAAAASGTPQHGTAESATAAGAAAPAGHGQADMAQHGAQHKTHKCTNVKLFSECRVNCEYVVEGKGAYFIFTDGEDGVPCKTRTLDGQVLSGACHQGLCMVKDQAASAPHGAAGTAAGAAAVSPGPGAAAAAAAAAVTPAAGHPAAANAAPAHAATAAAAAKHKKA